VGEGEKKSEIRKTFKFDNEKKRGLRLSRTQGGDYMREAHGGGKTKLKVNTAQGKKSKSPNKEGELEKKGTDLEGRGRKKKKKSGGQTP